MEEFALSCVKLMWDCWLIYLWNSFQILKIQTKYNKDKLNSVFEIFDIFALLHSATKLLCLLSFASFCLFVYSNGKWSHQSVTPRCSSCCMHLWRYVGSGNMLNWVLWSTLFQMMTSSRPVVTDLPMEKRSRRSKAILRKRRTFLPRGQSGM